MLGHANNAHAASTNTPFVLNKNPTPAATPLQKNCLRAVSSSAARWGASSNKSAASGSTAECVSNVRKNAVSAAAQYPSRCVHHVAASPYASTQHRNAYTAPAMRSTAPIRAPHNRYTAGTSGGLSNQMSRYSTLPCFICSAAASGRFSSVHSTPA